MNSATPIRVAVILGTRPEAIKLFPVIRALESEPCIELNVTVTGQHREMVDQILDPFGIVPDESLELMQHGQSLNSMVARVMPRLDDLYERTRPQFVLVQGDTTSAFCAGLAAFHRQIGVGHVEAGLRSGDRFQPFPEEVSRRMISSFAELHFAPTEQSADHLRASGLTDSTILVTGNTVVDALLQTLEADELMTRHRWSGLEDDGRPLVLVTLHRRESWSVEEREGAARPLEQVLAAIRDSCDAFPETNFVFPMHRNPAVREPTQKLLGDRRNAYLIEPLPYIPFVDLMRRASVILTDSGGIQEEAPTLGVPVLVARQTTERPEGVAAGVSRLVGTDAATIRAALAEELGRAPRRPRPERAANPFGDGRAGDRIRRAILAHYGLEKPPADFAFKSTNIDQATNQAPWRQS